ncbi:LysR family transcriptional regulator [Novosphingobium bradum]|uniref:LysR family transcriptional regulator n=1 Tax=Novosphingobium bradum TaxID=1737444 RepID=A0ABV7ILD3_9SPHN
MDANYALFARVVAEGSLSAAARSLGISPAMVSKRLARLEDRLGTQLLHRTTRRIALTEAGAELHREVAEILVRIGDIEARLHKAGRSPAGRLRVTAPTSFGRLHIAPHLPEFLALYPEVQLEIDLSDEYVDLLARQVHVAIRIATAPGGEFIARRLADNRRVLCAAPAYCAAHGAPQSVAELARHRLIAADGQLPWRLAAGSRNAELAGPSCVRTNSSELIRELALGGVGVALRSLWDVGDALADGRLVRILPEWEGSADVGIYAVHPRGRRVPPAAQVFAEFLRDRLARLDAGA